MNTTATLFLTLRASSPQELQLQRIKLGTFFVLQQGHAILHLPSKVISTPPVTFSFRKTRLFFDFFSSHVPISDSYRQHHRLYRYLWIGHVLRTRRSFYSYAIGFLVVFQLLKHSEVRIIPRTRSRLGPYQRSSPNFTSSLTTSSSIIISLPLVDDEDTVAPTSVKKDG